MGFFDFMKTSAARDSDALEARNPGKKVTYDPTGRGVYLDADGTWQSLAGDEYSYSNDRRDSKIKDAEMDQYKAQKALGTFSDAGISGGSKSKYAVDQTAANIHGLDSWQKLLSSGAQASASRTGPQDEWRQQQSSLAQALMAQSNGTGPSVAQAQLNQASDRNLANAIAMSHSQRGMGAAGNMRALANERGAIGQQQAADSGLLRLQEQQGARQALGGVLAGARGQDLGQQTQNDSMVQFYLSQGMSLDMAQATANLEMQKLLSNNALGLGSLTNQQLSIAQQGREADMKTGAAAAQGIGTGIATAYSDERLKADIRPGGGELAGFLDAIGAHKYRYKDEKHGEGEFVSPMAQELLKTSLGKSMVEKGEDGFRVNYGRGFGTMLASQAELHRRLKRLEGDE